MGREAKVSVILSGGGDAIAVDEVLVCKIMR